MVTNPVADVVSINKTEPVVTFYTSLQKLTYDFHNLGKVLILMNSDSI